MPLFGIAYLDTESFRNAAALFGVGMAFADYPPSDEGNASLEIVLQAASRAIDAFCGKDFLPDNKTEQQRLIDGTKIVVNNFPVAEIVSCSLEYSNSTSQDVPTTEIYINNQQNILEITSLNLGILQSLEIQKSLPDPVVNIVYKSLQSIPNPIKLACGYQAGHLINTGFVDKTLPPNFGKVDIGDLSINNKKGYKSSDEVKASSISPDAERLLTPFINYGVV